MEDVVQDTSRNLHKALCERVYVDDEVEESFSGQPAFFAEMFSHNLILFDAGYDFAYRHKPFLYQFGDGGSQFHVGFNAYDKLTDRFTVWGGAGYSTGVVKHVKWNSVADIAELYPYYLADTIGGTLRDEQYDFSGGCGYSKGRLNIAGQMSYRAVQDYRTTDPRIRNIVSDLQLKMGMKYGFGDYDVGMSLGMRIYGQTSSVEFYREAGKSPEYQMTGLGTCYERFSGDVNALYFKGVGFDGSLCLKPVHNSGFVVKMDLSKFDNTRIATSINSFPITTLHTYSFVSLFGFQRNDKRMSRWLVEVDYTRKSGVEHIAGNASSGSYPVITDLQMYRSNMLKCGANITLQKIVRNGRTFTVEPKVGFVHYDEDYRYPNRHLSDYKVFVVCNNTLSNCMSEKVVTTWNAEAGFYMDVFHSSKIPYVILKHEFIDMFRNFEEAINGHYAHLKVSMRYNYFPHRGRMFVFAEPSCCLLGCRGTTRYSCSVSCMITAGVGF